MLSLDYIWPGTTIQNKHTTVESSQSLTVIELKFIIFIKVCDCVSISEIKHKKLKCL